MLSSLVISSKIQKSILKGHQRVFTILLLLIFSPLDRNVVFQLNKLFLRWAKEIKEIKTITLYLPECICQAADKGLQLRRSLYVLRDYDGHIDTNITYFWIKEKYHMSLRFKLILDEWWWNLDIKTNSWNTLIFFEI